MNPLARELEWVDGAAPARAGVLRPVGSVLLLAVIPFSLVWLPVTRVPGVGTLTACDLALIGLWGVTALELLVRGVSGLDAESPLILLLAVAIAILAAAGAELSRPSGTAFLEFMMSMKKFGLAAILPLAASRFASPATRRWTRVLTLLGAAALVAFALVPELQDVLPRPDDWDDTKRGERSTGLGTNPNDFAYSAIAVAILHFGAAPLRSRVVDSALRLAVLAGCATAVIASGSRSGLAGAAGALAFVIATAAIRLRTKLALLFGVTAVLAVGLSTSTVFEERLARLARSGVGEANVSSRLEAQRLAIERSVVHPFGVGYRNIAWGTNRERRSYEYDTTDSVYFDTLVGAGYPGLVALLLLFWTAWKHLARAGGRGPHVRILQSGILAFLMFGAATVVPMSVFLSPLFFSLVSGASHGRLDRA